MAYSYRIDAAHRTALIAFTEQVTGHEIQEAVLDVYQDSAWQPSYHMILDLRYVHALVIEVGDVEEVVEQDRRYEPLVGNGLDVTVVGSELHYLAWRYYALKAKDSPRTPKVAWTLEDAWALVDGASMASGRDVAA